MAEEIGPPLAVGDVAVSLRGGDRGTVVLVWGILGGQRVAVVDGDVHPLRRPKPKNVRHLRRLGRSEELAHRMAVGERLTDADVERALAPHRQALEGLKGEGGDDDGQGGQR